MLQNLFNHLQLTELASSSQYTVERKSWKAYLGTRHPAGTVSVVLRFIAPYEQIVFDIHAFLAPNCDICASGMMDPKAIIIPGAVHLYG